MTVFNEDMLNEIALNHKKTEDYGISWNKLTAAEQNYVKKYINEMNKRRTT